MTNRATNGIQRKNRIQYITTKEGNNMFLEYWIHEWDDKGYNSEEHINNLEQAIKRAHKLGFKNDEEKLSQLQQFDNLSPSSK
jgi:hypothetical protein